MEKSWFKGYKIEIPHGTEPASQRCVDAVINAMRTRSEDAKKNFTAAARWFALASKEGR